MNVNKIKWASSDTALKIPTSGNQTQKGWDTSDGTITGITEKPNLQQTNFWMNAVYKWLDYINTIRTPLGTILVSALDEETFNSITSGGWVLCDGRDVSNSSWAILTSKNFAPDLRGYILGGAGSSGVNLQETGSPVEDIGFINQYVEDSVSLRTLSATAEAGDTAFEVGNKPVFVDNIAWSGTTDTLSNSTTRANISGELFFESTDGMNPQSNWFTAQMICLDQESSLNVNIDNFNHNHTLTGRLQGKNIIGSSTIITTPPTIRAAYSEPNTENYEFVPNSVGVSYFLRID